MERKESPFNLTEVHLGGDYDSAFETDSEAEKRRSERHDLVRSESRRTKKASKEFFKEEWSKEEGRKQRYHLLSLDAYSRHKKLVNEYYLCYPGATSLLQRNQAKDKTESDILEENHKFLWDEDEISLTWEQRLAKKYYDKLFKEYSVADLSRYKENKVALRWRTEQELIIGRGQFTCGNKNCTEKEGLCSWEVNFGYVEHGEKKNALVKLRLCPDCSYKLNYHHKRRKAKPKDNQRSPFNEGSAAKKQKLSDATTAEVSDDPSNSVEGQSSKPENSASTDVWKEPVVITDSKSQEEEFDDYLADMFL